MKDLQKKYEEASAAAHAGQKNRLPASELKDLYAEVRAAQTALAAAQAAYIKNLNESLAQTKRLGKK